MLIFLPFSAYMLHVQANSNPKETVHDLLRRGTSEDILLKPVHCEAWNNTGGFFCTVGYDNRANVSWDYPELWIAPVRHLQNIAYNNSAISIQFTDIFWSKAIVGADQYLYFSPVFADVDTALLTHRNETDICRSFLNHMETKCRVELREEVVTNQQFHITKLNLLVPKKLVNESSIVATQMRLANKLRWPDVSCLSPVQLRSPDAFYVPSHMLPNGKPFTFTVTYAHSEPEGLGGQSSSKDVCEKLKSYGMDLIEKCYGRVGYTNYSTIEVLMKATNASVWELQYKLMYRLNLARPDQCTFNVINTPIRKVYNGFGHS
ncbi:unnamed protein product [Dicrocoelium dendriticum]|nr:unnamed protein product [Dicrocoelium dendriticum]